MVLSLIRVKADVMQCGCCITAAIVYYPTALRSSCYFVGVAKMGNTVPRA